MNPKREQASEFGYVEQRRKNKERIASGDLALKIYGGTRAPNNLD
jgi:hypothetical protein